MDIMQTYREIRRNFVEKKNVGGEKRPYDDLERFKRGVSWFMDRYLPALDNNTKSAGQPLTGVDVLPEKGRIAVPALEGSTITAQYTGTSVEGEATATQTSPQSLVSRDVFIQPNKVESLRLHVDAADRGYQVVAYHHSVDRACPEKSYLETRAWLVPY